MWHRNPEVAGQWHRAGLSQGPACAAVPVSPWEKGPGPELHWEHSAEKILR